VISPTHRPLPTENNKNTTDEYTFLYWDSKQRTQKSSGYTFRTKDPTSIGIGDFTGHKNFQ